MENKIKKLGYGVSIHYNEYSKTFEVYKLGTYYPGNKPDSSSKLSSNKKLSDAIDDYLKVKKTNNWFEKILNFLNF